MRKQGTLPPTQKEVNVVLENHTTNELLAKTESNITRFELPSNMTTSRYPEELVIKILCCADVYEEYALNEIFIECLKSSIRYTLREYWRGKKAANLHDLAFQATSLLKPKGHNIKSKRTTPAANKQQHQTHCG